jgi:2-keto-3-deoxy-6-phosphogluconate aldolase
VDTPNVLSLPLMPTGGFDLSNVNDHVKAGFTICCRVEKGEELSCTVDVIAKF